MAYLFSPWGPSLDLIVLSVLVVGITLAILWQEFPDRRSRGVLVMAVAIIALSTGKAHAAVFLPYDICSQDIPYWLWLLYGCWGS